MRKFVHSKNKGAKGKPHNPDRQQDSFARIKKTPKQIIITILKYIFSPLAILIALALLPFAVIIKTVARLFKDFEYKGLYGVIVSAEFFLLCGVLLVLYLLCIPIWGDTALLYWPMREMQDFYSGTNYYQYDPYALVSALFLGFVALIFTVKQSEIANINLEQNKPEILIQDCAKGVIHKDMPVFSVENKGASDAFNIRIYYKKKDGDYHLLNKQKDCILQSSDSYCIGLDYEGLEKKSDDNIFSFIISYQNSATKRPYLYGATVVFSGEKIFRQPIGVPILFEGKPLQSPISKDEFSEMSKLQQFYSRPSNYPENFSERITHMIKSSFNSE